MKKESPVRSTIVPFALILAAIVYSLFQYPRLDSYYPQFSDLEWATTKPFIVSLMPLLMVCLFALFRFTSRKGRNEEHRQRIKGSIDAISNIILALLLIIHIIFLRQALGHETDFLTSGFLPVCIGMPLIIVGNFLPRLYRSEISATQTSPQQAPEWLAALLKIQFLGLFSSNPALQMKFILFLSRIYYFGGLAILLSALLPSPYSTIGAVGSLAALAILMPVGAVRLKKRYR